MNNFDDFLSRRAFLERAAGLGLSIAGLSLLTGCGGGGNGTSSVTDTRYSGTLSRANSQMRAILDEYLSFNVPPLYTLTPQQARLQPSIQDAAKSLLAKSGRSTAPEAVASVRNTTVPGPAGALPVRVYTPSGTGPFPVIVYFHGGGWVIATIDTYDASCRALANAAKAVVISVEYRKGPENKFPAAHEDAYAATQYVINNASQFGGDPARVATAGESAGGNLASAVCFLAIQRGGKIPKYQVLIYPVANNDLNSQSFLENANAIPLSKPLVQYFLNNYLPTPADSANPLISLVKQTIPPNLPPATIITDEIDPLRTEGQLLAQKFSSAGIAVRSRTYGGVTHEFFGLGAVLSDARDAVSYAADGLRSAFGTS